MNKSPWNITLLAVFIAVVVYAFSTMLAKGEELIPITSKIVLLKGEFTNGTTARVKWHLSANPQVNQIILHSNGGLFGEGVNLGLLLHERKLIAVVMEGEKCVSSCAFAFLGADKQSMKGLLAFHRAWMTDRKVTQNKILGDGQQLGGYMLWYMLKVGYHSQFTYLITSQTDQNTFLVFDSKSSLDRLFVSVDPKRPIEDFIGKLGISSKWVKEHTKKSGEF